MEDMKGEVPYPPGHNWEGLTPSQVNAAYENEEMGAIQSMMKEESGKEVFLELLSNQEEPNANPC